jgi:hypothetical protein
MFKVFLKGILITPGAISPKKGILQAQARAGINSSP